MQTVPRSQLSIAKDLIAQIENGALKEGDHLRERDLAERYGVSRTPIRGALTLLVERGLLAKQDNRGFFVNGRQSRSGSLPHDPLDAIYDRATRDWFERRVSSTFTDTDFQARYGVGRPLAARVLARMAQDGIIERNPGQGWHFPPTLNTRNAHDDSYAFRRILEPAGILEPGFRINLDEAANLEKEHLRAIEIATNSDAEPAPGKSFALNASFHEAVARWSGNQFILAAIIRQNRLRRLLEYASFTDSSRRVITLQEHLDILDLLKKGDNLGAASLMRDHLRAAETATAPRMKN